MSTTTDKATTLTLAQASQAFADWESDYRANPDSFLTDEETAAMELATVSEARAIHFMALLRQRSKANALWIEVTARIPELIPDAEGFPVSTNVLVFCANDAYMVVAHAAIYDEEVHWYDLDGDPCTGVTHWMDLPATPTNSRGVA